MALLSLLYVAHAAVVSMVVFAIPAETYAGESKGPRSKTTFYVGYVQERRNMPIEGLSNQVRFPRLGKIRLGIKVKPQGKAEYPKAVEKVKERNGRS